MAFRGVFRRSAAARGSFAVDNSSISTPTDVLLEKSPMPTQIVLGKESTFGAKPVVKTLYEKEGKGWVETPPKQLSKKISKAYDGVAIKVYKVADAKQPTIAGRTPMKIQSIEIQSPALVAALKDVLESVETFLVVHETAIFRAPFKPLYFCYDKIMALYDQAGEDVMFKEHLHLLKELMGELFGGMMTRLRHLRESKLISYDLAWTYFHKDSTVYCGAEDCERLFRVLDTEYDCNRCVMIISCQEIRFTGSKFKWQPASLEIPGFGGNVPITSLRNYPLSFHSDRDQLKAKLVARGKLVLDYQDLKYREYSGTGKSEDPDVKRHNVGETLNGRIRVILKCFAGVWTNPCRFPWVRDAFQRSSATIPTRGGNFLYQTPQRKKEGEEQSCNASSRA